VPCVTSLSFCTQCDSVADKWPNDMGPEASDVMAMFSGYL
jgi:cytochrome c2